MIHLQVSLYFSVQQLCSDALPVIRCKAVGLAGVKFTHITRSLGTESKYAPIAAKMWLRADNVPESQKAIRESIHHMSFTKRIEFGNYTLTFGDTKVLLDLIDSIVEPSFRERRYVRKITNKGEYFFLDTKIINLDLDDGTQTAAIAGRIVKNTKLHRDQIYSDGEIIHDKKELETAPSSIFVLLLENHRLIFCREVSGAPSIQNFESTSQSFLHSRHKEFIASLLSQKEEELKSVPPRGTKTALLREFPPPDLRVTPLSDRESLEGFIDRFKTIEQLTIKLLPTNHEEINNDDFWIDFSRRNEQMQSSSTTVRFVNNKDGLKADEVVAQTSAATEMGNSSVSLTGHDDQGDLIKGNNEDFTLTIEVGDLPNSIEEAGVAMHKNFLNLSRRGFIVLPVLAAGIMDRVRAFADRHSP